MTGDEGARAGAHAVGRGLDLADAVRLASACMLASAGGADPLAVAVVDASGGLLYLHRLHRVPPLVAELVIAKATTAATFGMPRAAVQDWQRRKPVLHAQLSAFSRYPVVPMSGAVAVTRGGAVLGGLAVESGSAADQTTCRDALAACGYDDDPLVGEPLERTGSPFGAVTPPGAAVAPDELSATTADRIASDAMRMADDLGRAVSVVVADHHGDPLAVRRSHHSANTIDIAAAKAYTSAVLGRDTTALEEWQEEYPVLALQLSRLGPRPLIADFGGSPVISAGRLIGGLGVSGARGEEDQQICGTVLRDL